MQPFDHRPVRHADPEGQPATAEGLRGGRLLSQRQGMARVGGHDAHPELHPARLGAGDRKNTQRVNAAGEVCRPHRGKAVRFGPSSVLDDLQR